jgi:hypothetical protein
MVDELSLAFDELLVTAEILALCEEIINYRLFEELVNSLSK